MNTDPSSLEQHCINTVRVLAADAVQKANSGHPGAPMGLAPVGHVLWSESMIFDPNHPDWPNRDRFILSNGHACMLQYSYLFLTGYALTLDDIKNFRQLHSKTPGHPEHGLTSGIEVTTGPLGQGFANGVGFAIGRDWMAARYNKPGFDLFNYHVFGICSDGDMMEGISSEAASLAGHLKLGGIVYLYDNNHISIEGNTDLTFDENVGARFEAYGWHVQEIADGNDTRAIAAAIEKGKAETGRPSLISIRTHIAYGSPNKVDTAGAHGSPLGVQEVRLVKENLGFDPDQSFVIPDQVRDFYHKAGSKGGPVRENWTRLFESYREKYPDLAREFEQLSAGHLPAGWTEKLPNFKAGDQIATRKASGKILNAIASSLPTLIGGSADLSPSTDTMLDQYTSFSAQHREGRNFHFGIREHAMGAILNGLALTPGIIPYGATFLIFSDYMRPPIRLASIMKIRPIYVFTHDSIGLGEDGTTHQPVEQLIGLRSVPHITVIRPADANETTQAWRAALEHSGGPVALVLTRQNLPVMDQQQYGKAEGLQRGAYILSEAHTTPNLILIASGSEVQLVLQAQPRLKEKGIAARVVSMPSWELFERQAQAYRDLVFPPSLTARIAVEAGSPIGWLRYTTLKGKILGMTEFGTSAPGEVVFREYGFTVEHVVEMASGMVAGH
ncbi:MAG TPA: transketolase [Chitinophagaceae bacterium]|nr:transketolase [Chitinophagaceae bacterium]